MKRSRKKMKTMIYDEGIKETNRPGPPLISTKETGKEREKGKEKKRDKEKEKNKGKEKEKGNEKE